MREEFKKIAEDLEKWCDKYNKDYATITVCDGVLMGSIHPEDEDYIKCNISEIINENKLIDRD